MDALPPKPAEPASAYTGYPGLRCWPRAWDPNGANVYLAEGINKALRKAGFASPVITAGKIPMPDDAEEILSEKKTDLIGLGRPLLCDPDWVNKAVSGVTDEIVRCVYCNHCSEVNDLFQVTNCLQWPKGAVNAPKPSWPKVKKL